jgi:hypothetical protein
MTSPMEQQNYGNHRRFIFLYHGVLFSLIVLTILGSVVNLVQSLGDSQRTESASLILVLSFCLLLSFFFSRSFSLRAQDRAIRAEENLRHYALTGKLLDPKLTIRQIIGLRFAPDGEFVPLADRAVRENLSEDDIKKSVKAWKGDYNRA